MFRLPVYKPTSPPSPNSPNQQYATSTTPNQDCTSQVLVNIFHDSCLIPRPGCFPLDEDELLRAVHATPIVITSFVGTYVSIQFTSMPRERNQWTIIAKKSPETSTLQPQAASHTFISKQSVSFGLGAQGKSSPRATTSYPWLFCSTDLRHSSVRCPRHGSCICRRQHHVVIYHDSKLP